MDAEAVVARVARTGVVQYGVLLMLLVLTAAPVAPAAGARRRSDRSR